MTKASFRGFELAISLLRTLGNVIEIRSRSVSLKFSATTGHRFYGLACR